MNAIEAEIIAVGSELLTPNHTDTNSLFITAHLNDLGIQVRRKSVVGDRIEDIGKALSDALARAEIIIFSGGLGPTQDDLTREAVSEALGRQMHSSEQILEEMKGRFERIRIRLTPNNERQAHVPDGAEILDNPNGTAPGLFLQEGPVLIFLLPGPPRELKPMMVDQVVPRIRRLKPVKARHFRRLRIASEAESRVDFRIAPIYREYKRIETTILSSPGLIEVWFTWQGGEDPKQADQQLDALTDRVAETLGPSVFTRGEESLQEVLGGLLRERGYALSTAESCTGGLIGKLLTEVPGSSDYYKGGVICYSYDLKVELVGVNETTLERFGAVSRQVAGQMARGICRRTGSDLGLSITGIAGPTGGSREKPVGLIFLGLCAADQVEVKQLQLPGNRETVRLRAARMALDWVRRRLQ